jgi:D-3-phosphoglycerate dehydrogenase
LREVGDVLVANDYSVQTLADAVREADILVTSCFATVPAQVINAGEKLRAVVKYGVGVDNIDLAAATARGVVVANCPDYGSGAIADMAFAMLLALARRLLEIDRCFRTRGWFWPEDEVCATSLEGQTLGIIGLGRIGRKMARRASGFEMKILAHDPYIAPAAIENEPYRVELVSLDRLLAESDFVSVHCILTPETIGLLGAAEFRRMKPTAYLIDVSRGAILDEPALIAALATGQIAGAGLDVFDTEPLPDNHPLLAMGDKVVLAPHLAWFTRQAAAAQSRQAADAVLDVLAGRTPRSVVNSR